MHAQKDKWCSAIKRTQQRALRAGHGDEPTPARPVYIKTDGGGKITTFSMKDLLLCSIKTRIAAHAEVRTCLPAVPYISIYSHVYLPSQL